MRCAGRNQGEKLAAECGRRLNPEYKSNAKPSSFILLEYSGLIAKALPQKKQSWWISTTAYGDFQPKKILIQTAADHSQCMGQIGAVSLHRD